MRTNKRVCAVIVRDKKILLIHRIKEGREYWVVPGGGVESGEDMEKALRREILEETGLRLFDFKFMEKDIDHEIEYYLYRCEVQDGEPSLGGPEKKDNCEKNSYTLEWMLIEKTDGLDLYPKVIKNLL